MRRIWARANPNAPSDSEEDEEEQKGDTDNYADHVSKLSCANTNRTKSIESTGEVMMEESGIKQPNLSQEKQKQRATSFIEDKSFVNQLLIDTEENKELRRSTLKPQ